MTLNAARLIDLAFEAFQGRRLADAEALARRALAINPKAAQALMLLGIIMAQGGRPADAVGFLGQAASLTPNDPGVHVNLGQVWLSLNQPAKAAESLQRAVRLVPKAAELQLMLGRALAAAGNAAGAVDAYRRALALDPGNPAIHLGLGAVQRSIGQWEAALETYQTALKRQPNVFEAHANMANVLRDLGRVEEALAAHERALALAPGNAQVRFGYACSLLLDGRFEAGWHHYEARWQGTASLADVRRPAELPQWRGEALAGKTLFVYHEQGFGDTLQCLRYLPLLLARGAKVILRVPPELQRLARTLPGITVIASDEGSFSADCQCPMMSLPLAFGTTLASIPGETPYLNPDPGLVAAWRARLAGEARMRVGVCWQGGQANDYDKMRSLGPAALAPLAAIENVAFISLQKEGIAGKDPGMATRDFSADLSDFAETAALINNLDLVISVDTAVAHLAGALAKPVWLLNRFNTEWRWLRERSDSPWYPTMRIFRQPLPGEWSAVIAEVACELKSMAGNR